MADGPLSRAYFHLACGSATTVSGRDLSLVSNPFRIIRDASCAKCGTHFPLTQYVWEDTRESVANARSRWAAEAPKGVKSLNSGDGFWAAFTVGAAIGAVISWVLGDGITKSVGIGAVMGGIALAIIWQVVIVPVVTKQIYGWDSRQLK